MKGSYIVKQKQYFKFLSLVGSIGKTVIFLLDVFCWCFWITCSIYPIGDLLKKLIKKIKKSNSLLPISFSSTPVHFISLLLLDPHILHTPHFRSPALYILNSFKHKPQNLSPLSNEVWNQLCHYIMIMTRFNLCHTVVAGSSSAGYEGFL